MADRRYTFINYFNCGLLQCGTVDTLADIAKFTNEIIDKYDGAEIDAAAMQCNKACHVELGLPIQDEKTYKVYSVDMHYTLADLADLFEGRGAALPLNLLQDGAVEPTVLRLPDDDDLDFLQKPTAPPPDDAGLRGTQSPLVEEVSLVTLAVKKDDRSERLYCVVRGKAIIAFPELLSFVKQIYTVTRKTLLCSCAVESVPEIVLPGLLPHELSNAKVSIYIGSKSTDSAAMIKAFKAMLPKKKQITHVVHNATGWSV